MIDNLYLKSIASQSYWEINSKTNIFSADIHVLSLKDILSNSSTFG